MQQQAIPYSADMVCPATPLPFDPSKSISNPNSISDPSTGRISAAAVQSMIDERRRQGLLPPAPKYDQPPGDLAGQINTDVTTYNNLQAEYCYYEAQYKKALSEYLNAVTSTDTSLNVQAKTLLLPVTSLNARLNSLLEIMNALSQDRANNVESNKGAINQANKRISEKLSGLQDQYNRITKGDHAVLVQKRMVEYTEEKNNAVSNQIGLYIALNIAAIGMIFFISKSL
jgi:hypothetical protein